MQEDGEQGQVNAGKDRKKGEVVCVKDRRMKKEEKEIIKG